MGLKWVYLLLLFTSLSAFGLSRRPSSVAAAENSEWSAQEADFALGYEAGAGSLSIIGQNLIIVGAKLSPNYWVDVYFGYTRDENSTTTTNTLADNALTNARTDTTTYSGSANPHTFSVGAAIRGVLYQNSWVQIHAGPIAAVVLPNFISYNTGSMVRTYADKDDTANYSVSDSVGTVDVSNDLLVHVGLRLGSEFYLRWFPHLALGFNTGLLTSLGGETTTVTTTRSKTYNVVNGVNQTPATDSSSTSTAVLDRGLRTSTFGIGGTGFNLFGTFLIRYVW